MYARFSELKNGKLALFLKGLATTAGLRKSSQELKVGTFTLT